MMMMINSSNIVKLAICAAVLFVSHVSVAHAASDSDNNDEGYDLDIELDQQEIITQDFVIDMAGDSRSTSEMMQMLQTTVVDKWNSLPDRPYNFSVASLFVASEDVGEEHGGSLRSRRLGGPIIRIGGLGPCSGCVKLPLKGDDTHSKTMPVFVDFACGLITYNCTSGINRRALSSAASGSTSNAPVSSAKAENALIAKANALVTIANMQDILDRNSRMDDDDVLAIRDLRKAIRAAGGDSDKVEELKAKLQGIFASRDSKRESRKHRKQQVRKANRVVEKANKVLANYTGTSDLAARLEQLIADVISRNAANNDANGTV